MHGDQRQAIQYSYLAGLLDGEGCFRIDRQLSPGTMRQGNRNPKYNASISIHMVEREPLDFFRSIFPNGHMVFEGVREDRPNQRATYCWRCRNKETVIVVVNNLLPYMLVKHRQALLLKEFCEGHVDLRNLDVSLATLEIQRREQLYQKVKKLNAVGAAATTNPRSLREKEVIV